MPTGKVKVYTTDCRGWAVTITERQLTILRLLANGQDGVGVRDSLHFGNSTFKAELTTVLQKLAAENRTHVVAKALRAGLIE